MKKKTTEKTTRFFSKKKKQLDIFQKFGKTQDEINNRLFKDTHYCRNLRDIKAITTSNISKSQ